MSDAAPEFDPFISSGPDPERSLWVVQQLEGQAGPFFDSVSPPTEITTHATTEPEVVESRDKVQAILLDKKLSYPEKVIGITRYIFDVFAEKRTVEPTFMPTNEDLDELYAFALALYDARKRIDVIINLELLDEGVTPYAKISPLAEAETVAKRRHFDTEPELSLLMIKIWVADYTHLDMPSSYEAMRKQALEEARKQAESTRHKFY